MKTERPSRAVATRSDSLRLREALEPLLQEIESLNEPTKEYDRQLWVPVLGTNRKTGRAMRSEGTQ